MPEEHALSNHLGKEKCDLLFFFVDHIYNASSYSYASKNHSNAYYVYLNGVTKMCGSARGTLERAICWIDRYVGMGNNSLMIDRVNGVLESKIVFALAYHESNMRSTKMGGKLFRGTTNLGEHLWA